MTNLERARQAPDDPRMARVAPGGPGGKTLGSQSVAVVLIDRSSSVKRIKEIDYYPV